VQVVNRIQKLRKTAQLEPTDPVDVYYESAGDDKDTLEEILKSQVSYNWLINMISILEYLFHETTLFCTESVY
jgi:hypothetical protein